MTPLLQEYSKTIYPKKPGHQSTNTLIVTVMSQSYFWDPPLVLAKPFILPKEGQFKSSVAGSRSLHLIPIPRRPAAHSLR